MINVKGKICPFKENVLFQLLGRGWHKDKKKKYNGAPRQESARPVPLLKNTFRILTC
jgi:hypothetical protein